MRKILALMIVITVLLSGCSRSSSSEIEKRLGDTSSNISNAALVTQDGSDIFYFNLINGQLIKADKTLENKQVILEERAINIIVVEDWIYAISSDDETNEHGIYRFKKDGSHKERIMGSLGGAFTFLNDSNQWIYALGTAADSPEDIGIYKINIETKETIKLSDDNINHSLSFDGQCLYYINSSVDNRIYRMKGDGSERESISGTGIMGMVIEGDWIYYVGDSIYKMKKDGTQITEVINIHENGAIHVVKAMNVYKGWIYLSTYTWAERRFKLIKFKTDGSNKTTILEENVQVPTFLYIKEDYIYYGNNTGIHRIKIDGTNKEVVSEWRP